jgi:hypothetical protein
MTEPPAGWTSPGDPPSGYGPPPGAQPTPPPPPGYYPPAGYAPPPGYPPPYGTPVYGAPLYGGPVGLPPGVVPLRPLTVGELLDGAVKVIRRYPRPALGISAVVAVVTTVVNLLVVLGFDLQSLTNDLRSGEGGTSVTVGSGSTGGSAASIPGALIAVLAGLVLTGALVVVVGKAVLGKPTSFGEVWAEVRPRLLSLLGLAILTGLLVAVPGVVGGLVMAVSLAAAGTAGLLLGVPALLAGLVGMAYLYGRLSLAPAALVLEKARIRTALTRSGELVKGSWWRVFGILLLTSIIGTIVSSVLVFPLALLGGIAAFSSDATTGSVALFVILTQIGSGLASFLVSPFTAGVRALLYVDRRMRAEGLDLTLQQAASQG